MEVGPVDDLVDHLPIVGRVVGRDLATANLEFKVRGLDVIGRKSQTWVRFPGRGWKFIAAHVSTMDDKPLS